MAKRNVEGKTLTEKLIVRSNRKSSDFARYVAKLEGEYFIRADTLHGLGVALSDTEARVITIEDSETGQVWMVQRNADIVAEELTTD